LTIRDEEQAVLRGTTRIHPRKRMLFSTHGFYIAVKPMCRP